MMVRLTRDLRSFVRTPLNGAAAVETARRQLHTRGERFLAMAEHSIFAQPDSPYLRLLRRRLRAGRPAPSRGPPWPGRHSAAPRRRRRVRHLRRVQGARGDRARKPALQRRRAGFRLPSARGAHRNSHRREPGRRQPAGARARLHRRPRPDERAGLRSARPRRSRQGAVARGGGPPVLQYAKAGHTPIAWFYPVAPLSVRSRALSAYLRALGRLAGWAPPPPVFLDLQEPGRLARWLADRLHRGLRTCLTTYASSAVRVCAAAREIGLDLSGVVFFAIGEPFTEARRRIVAEAGASAVPAYAFNEAGTLGFACREARRSDDVHLFSNHYGLIQRSRLIGDSAVAVDAFLVTSLLTTGPKVLLNVESGDHGIVTRRPCGCLFGALGLTRTSPRSGASRS